MSDRFAAMALDVDAPSRMTIVSPMTGKPLTDEGGAEAFIDLLSGDSEKARAFDHRRANRNIDRRERGSRNRDPAGETEEFLVERTAALTVGWHLVGLDGRALDVPFSEDAARELYAARSMAYVLEQVLSFQADRANFGKASSKS